MANIITISRTFASGGREVAKRLSDRLEIAYYDKQLIHEITNNSGLDESFVEAFGEDGYRRNYGFTYGRSFIGYQQSIGDMVFIEQMKTIRKIAEKHATSNTDFIIVGRGADDVLGKDNPFKVFIYSSNMDARIERCRKREEGIFTPKQLEKQIVHIDKQRQKTYEYFSSHKWGDKNGYHILIDTSVYSIKDVVEIIVVAYERWNKNKK